MNVLVYNSCGKSCSHAAAIAFKVEAAVRTGAAMTATTSKLCQWNNMSRKKVPTHLYLYLYYFEHQVTCLFVDKNGCFSQFSVIEMY